MVPSRRWAVHGSCLCYQGDRSTDGKELAVTGLYTCLGWPANAYVLLVRANDIPNVRTFCPATTPSGAHSRSPRLCHSIYMLVSSSMIIIISGRRGRGIHQRAPWELFRSCLQWLQWLHNLHISWKEAMPSLWHRYGQEQVGRNSSQWSWATRCRIDFDLVSTLNATIILYSGFILQEKVRDLKRRFHRENFHSFAITQFAMLTDLASFSGRIWEQDKDARQWATNRATWWSS